MNLSLQLASMPDREKLVVEILVGDAIAMELSQEGEDPLLEIYPNPDGNPWVLPLHDLQNILEQATKRLLASE